jgi:hypothetical protein
MGFVTCSATHRFARRGNVHLQRDIDAACPECHKHDTLRWLDLFNDEFVATTTCTDDLFEEGGQLNHLYRAVVRTSAHEAGALQWEFERRVNVPSRQGMVLSYLAQALRNDGMDVAQDDYEHLGVRPEVVVVVTLAIQDGQPLFFIGVNGHDNTYQAAESFCSAMPADLCGVPCIHVFERDPHAHVGVRLGYDVSGWSWHGEQNADQDHAGHHDPEHDEHAVQEGDLVDARCRCRTAKPIGARKADRSIIPGRNFRTTENTQAADGGEHRGAPPVVLRQKKPSRNIARMPGETKPVYSWMYWKPPFLSMPISGAISTAQRHRHDHGHAADPDHLARWRSLLKFLV